MSLGAAAAKKGAGVATGNSTRPRSSPAPREGLGFCDQCGELKKNALGNLPDSTAGSERPAFVCGKFFRGSLRSLTLLKRLGLRKGGSVRDMESSYGCLERF